MRKKVELVANRVTNLWRDEVGHFFESYEEGKKFVESQMVIEDLSEQTEAAMEEVFQTIDSSFSTVSDNNRGSNSPFLTKDQVDQEIQEAFLESVKMPENRKPILLARPTNIATCDNFNIAEIKATKYIASKVRPGIYSVLLTSTNFKDIEGTLLKLCEEDPRFYFAIEFGMLNLDNSKNLIIDYLNSLNSDINVSRIKLPTISFEKFKTFVSQCSSTIYSEYLEVIEADSWQLEKDVFDFIYCSLIVLMWRNRVNFEIAIKEHFLFQRNDEYGAPIEDLDFLVRSYWEINNSKELFSLFQSLSFEDEGQTDRFLIDDSFEVKIERFMRALASLNSKRRLYEGDALIVSALILAKNQEIPFLLDNWSDSKLLKMPELQALEDVYQIYSAIWEDSSLIERVISRPYSIQEIENTIKRVYDSIFSQNSLYELKNISDFKKDFDIILTRNRTSKATGLEVKKNRKRNEKYTQVSFNFIKDKVIYSATEPDAMSHYINELYQNTSNLGFSSLKEIRDFSCDVEKNLEVIILDGCLNPDINQATSNIAYNLFCFSVVGKAFVNFPDSLSEFCKAYMRSVIASSTEKESEEMKESIFEAAKKAASSVNLSQSKQCYKIFTDGAFIEGIDNSNLLDEMWTPDGMIAVMDFINRNSKSGREVFLSSDSTPHNVNPMEIKGGTILYPASNFLLGKRLGERRKIESTLYGVQQDIKTSVPQLLGWRYVSKQTYIFDRERFQNQSEIEAWVSIYEELQNRQLEVLELKDSENFVNMINLKRARNKFNQLSKVFNAHLFARIEQSLSTRVMSSVSTNAKGLALIANPIFRAGNDNLVKLLGITLINNEFEVIREEILLGWVEEILNSDAIYNISIA